MLTPQLVTFDTDNGCFTTWDIFLKSDEPPDIVNQIQETGNEIDHISVQGNLMATCEYKPAEKTFSILIYDLTLPSTIGSDVSQIIYPRKNTTNNETRLHNIYNDLVNDGTRRSRQLD